MSLLAFDLDGTLIQVGQRADFENPGTFRQHCRPYPEAWDRVREVHADGHGVFFLSGRRESWMGLTLAQIHEYGGPEVAAAADVDLVRRADAPFSWDRYVIGKADALQAMDAALYVGDRDEDQTAAAMAGVPFMRADWWRWGLPWKIVTESRIGSVVRHYAAMNVRHARNDGVLPFMLSLRMAAKAGKVAGVQSLMAGRMRGNVDVAAGGKA